MLRYLPAGSGRGLDEPCAKRASPCRHGCARRRRDVRRAIGRAAISLLLLFVALAAAYQLDHPRRATAGDATALTVTQTWARQVAGAGYDDLPPPVVEKLVLTLADCAGVWVYASGLEHVERFRELTDSAGRGEATEWVSGRRVSLAEAAAINAFALHAHEIDDSNLRNQLRASCAAVPAPLAVAEAVDASGRELLVALAISYQVSDALATAMNRQPAGRLHQRGWMPTSMCGPLGGAAAAGRLLELNADQLTSAMGLSAGGAGGLFQYYHDGSDEKRVHVARAQRVAVESARLARAGFLGAPGAVDGAAGLLAALGFAPSETQLPRALAPWDAVLHVKPKFYACSQGVIPWLEVLEPLLDQSPLEADAVREVLLSVDAPPESHYVAKINHFQPPLTLLDAQLSVNFGLALRICRGAAFVDEYTAENLAAADILALARRVRAIRDSEKPGQLRVELADGRVLRGRYEPANFEAVYEPVVDDYRRKFDRLAGEHLSPAQCEALWQHVVRLPEAASVARWSAELAGHMQRPRGRSVQK